MKIIGLGAAGNKAVEYCVNEGIIDINDVKLLNSTEKDFPANFDHNQCILVSDIGGCGKERSNGKAIMLNYIKLHWKDQITNWFDDNDTQVYLIASTGGGTGSGMICILAKFLKEKLDLDVTIIALAGFREDVRERQNTVEFFQELSDEYTVQVIDNSKFLKEAKGNNFKAEILANKEVCQRIHIMSGAMFRNSSQNLDETDLYKTLTYPKYQTVEYTEVEDVKNADDMDEIIKDMIDNSKSFATEPSCQGVGLIVNLSPKNQDYFDWSCKRIQESYGEFYELFKHKQEPATKEDKEWIALIVSGMKLPKQEVIDIYNEYKEETAKVDKSKDDFFDVAESFVGDAEDGQFDRGRRRRRMKKNIEDVDDFLDEFKPNKGSNVKVSEDKTNGTIIHQVASKF